MLENEEASLKLKSEIVLLTNKIDTNDDETTKKLFDMRERVETENQTSNGETIKELRESAERLARENELQKTRIE